MATTEFWSHGNGTLVDDILEGNFTVAPTIEAFFDGDLMLHPFWYPYLPMIHDIPPYVHYFIGLFIAFVCGIAILGNILIIYMFSTIKSLRTPSNLFIINMAISDLGFSMVNGFPLMTISSFMQKWYFGKIACELYAFFGGLFGFNSINSLAWVSYDRMFVITKPFEAMRKATMKRSAIQLVFIWCWSLLWAVPPLIGWGAYIPEGFMTSCSFDYLTRSITNMTYVFSMFGGGFLAPVGMIVVCYIEIIRAVTAQNKEMSKTAEKMGAQESKDSKAKKQEITLAKVAAVTITFFMLSWLPYATVAIGAMAGYTWLINPYTCVIPVLFAKCSAVWNPILYSLSHPRFRAALDDMFPALVLCRGMCMDKGGDDAEDSDTKNKNKKTKAMSRGDSTCSETSEITDIGSSAAETVTVQMSANPQSRSGGQPPPRPHSQPRQTDRPRQQLQPQEPRVAPTGGSYQTASSPQPSPSGRRRSFRESIGRAAGEAYKNLIDAYVGLKNVSDKLGDKRSALTLADHHPASRRSSAAGYENPAYTDSGSRPTSPVMPGAVYSVPVVYQQPPMAPAPPPMYGYPQPSYILAPGAQPGMMPGLQLAAPPAVVQMGAPETKAADGVAVTVPAAPETPAAAPVITVAPTGTPPAATAAPATPAAPVTSAPAGEAVAAKPTASATSALHEAPEKTPANTQVPTTAPSPATGQTTPTAAATPAKAAPKLEDEAKPSAPTSEPPLPPPPPAEEEGMC